MARLSTRQGRKYLKPLPRSPPETARACPRVARCWCRRDAALAETNRPRFGQGPRRGHQAQRVRPGHSPPPSRATATPARCPSRSPRSSACRRSASPSRSPSTASTVKVQRQTEAGYDEVESPLPAVVVSVTAGVVEPRYPSFKGIMAAKSKPVDEVTPRRPRHRRRHRRLGRRRPGDRRRRPAPRSARPARSSKTTARATPRSSPSSRTSKVI